MGTSNNDQRHSKSYLRLGAWLQRILRQRGSCGDPDSTCSPLSRVPPSDTAETSESKIVCRRCANHTNDMIIKLFMDDVCHISVYNAGKSKYRDFIYKSM